MNTMSRTDKNRTNLSRRTFVQTAAAGSLAILAAPAFVTAGKTGEKRPVVGVDGHQYEVDHYWAQLPDKYSWQTTHNVAIGRDGLVYVIHEGHQDKPEHPSIFVFDPDGQFVRAFGNQFQGGGHGIEVRQEGGEQFLYVAAYLSKRSFAKLTPTGETVWHHVAPMQAGGYAEGEDEFPHAERAWGRDRFNPTNFAFLPNGGFLLADGYGSFRIHRYDADGNWQSSFGSANETPDKPAGTFNTPHGLWIDDRGEKPLIVVTDRANARLQWFSLAGEHRATQDGFLLPANADVQGDLLLIPDLVGRVTLLGKDNQVIAHLGDNSEVMQADKRAIRGDESAWVDGKFVHPHDACFDSDGNIYVAEWVATGRVSKLTKLS
jgi:DNA-binding beta-propeller fold protein YncE